MAAGQSLPSNGPLDYEIMNRLLWISSFGLKWSQLGELPANEYGQAVAAGGGLVGSPNPGAEPWHTDRPAAWCVTGGISTIDVAPSNTWDQRSARAVISPTHGGASYRFLLRSGHAAVSLRVFPPAKRHCP